MPPPKMKNELKSSLGILNHLSKFSPVTGEVCDPLHKLTSVKQKGHGAECTGSIRESKKMVKRYACMEFYDVARPLYLETDSSILVLKLDLHVRDGINCRHDEILDNAVLLLTAFASKSSSSREWHYNNIECKALRFPH